MSKSITATVAAKMKISAEQTDDYPNGYIDVIPTDSLRNANGDQFDTASLRWPLAEGGYATGSALNGKVLDIPAFKNHSRDVDDMIGGVKSATWDENSQTPVLRIGLTSLERGQEVRTLAQEGFLNHNVSLTYSTDADDFTIKDGVIYDANIDEVSIVWKGANKEARVTTVASKSEEDKMDGKSREAAKLTLEPDELKAIAEQVAQINQDGGGDNQDQKQQDNKPTDNGNGGTPTTPDEKDKAAAKTAGKEYGEMDGDKTPSVAIEAAKTTAGKSVAPATVNKSKSAKVMDKIELTAKQFVAFVNKDTEKLAALNKEALATYSNVKVADALLNTTTTADGGALVPSAELLADVYSLLGTYSAVANDLRVITLDKGDSLDVSTLITDVIMTEVEAEGGDKAVTKPVLGDANVSLREFAGIALVSKKLIRSAAVNVYAILRDSFARAIARKRAEMALTDATSGILNKQGVKEVAMAGTAVTYADIKKMPYAVDATASQGGKYYLSRAALEALDTETDKNGRDLDIITMGSDGLSGRFKNGYPFAVEESLTGASSEVIFGAMNRFGILLRQANVEDETFDTGVVNDGNVEHNLLQQNKVAERVAFYENVGYPLPNAFAKLVKETS